MKHLRALELITIIAATGSLRKSAAQLNIVPSALTRQLQELEHEFGTPLFDRAQQGMRLTAAGELVLGHARVSSPATTCCCRSSRTSPGRVAVMSPSPVAKPSRMRCCRPK